MRFVVSEGMPPRKDFRGPKDIDGKAKTSKTGDIKDENLIRKHPPVKPRNQNVTDNTGSGSGIDFNKISGKKKVSRRF